MSGKTGQSDRFIRKCRVVQNPNTYVVAVFFTQIVQIVSIFDDLYFLLAPDGITVDGFFFSIDENRRAFAEVGDENGVGTVRVGGMHGVRPLKVMTLRGVGRALNTVLTTLPAYSLRRGILFTDTRPSQTDGQTNVCNQLANAVARGIFSTTIQCLRANQQKRLCFVGSFFILFLHIKMCDRRNQRSGRLHRNVGERR